MKEVISVSNCGKLGDFLLSLPVCSWIWKNQGKKINWVLADNFEPFHHAESLLRLQEMTHSVSLAPLPVKNWGCGGQPYDHDLRALGFDGECLCLGFPDRPDYYVPDYLADRFKLGVDGDFILDLGEHEKTDAIAATETLRRGASVRPQLKKSILYNAQRFAGAKERHCAFSGMAVLMDLARVPFSLYGSAEKVGEVPVYFKWSYSIAS